MEKRRFKAGEEEGQDIGDGITRIKMVYALLTCSQNRAITQPVVQARAHESNLLPWLGSLGVQVIFPILADMETQGTEGCSTLVPPCLCLDQTRWHW